jgi:hypothetical protein
VAQLTPEDERERVIDAVVGPTSQAYYSDRVRSGSTARVRAQAAQSTITLFAGGLVAALTFTALADRPMTTQVSGITAVSLWLISAVMYLRAVALPVPVLNGAGHVASRLDLVSLVLEKADQEAVLVDRRQRQANFIALLALVASVVTLALGVFLGPIEKSAIGTIVVNQPYSEVLHKLCGLSGDDVTGRIDTQSLERQFVKIEMPSGHCTDGSSILSIPRAAVSAISMGSHD